jgi:hypothetical protein
MARLTSGVYEVRRTFRAPLGFSYRWCTDYSDRDPGLEGTGGTRRVLERTRRRVVYEDLEKTRDGWSWSRWTVQLRPPDRWRGVAVGNYRSWTIDYRLEAVGPERTGFRLRGRRRPMLLGTKNPPRGALERDLARSWRKLARALESDYRRAAGGRRATAGRRR